MSGVPDVAGYLRLEGLPVPEHVLNAARIFRYHQQVFIAPPWPEIFIEDAERKQSLETAEKTYRAMAEVYTELGYEPLPLPPAPVAERVRFARAVIR